MKMIKSGKWLIGILALGLGFALMLNCGDEGEKAEVCSDSDGDGFYSTSGCGTAVDCNDNNADINPGATEIFDGIDNDCDRFVDEMDAEDYSTPQSAIIPLKDVIGNPSVDNLWTLSCSIDHPEFSVYSGGCVLHEHIYENSPELTTTVPAPNGDYHLYVGGMIWDPWGTYDNWDCRSIKIKKQGEISYTSYGYPDDGSGVIDLGTVTITSGSYTIYVDDDSGSCDAVYYDYVKLVPLP